MFEIFTETEKIFQSKENISRLPSLIIDKHDSKIKGFRCFSDLTVPLSVPMDEDMYTNPNN